MEKTVLKDEFMALVVDPHPLVRDGIKRSLEQMPHLSVVAEAGDGTAALYAGRRHSHDVLVTSARLADRDAISFVKEFRAEFPNTAIVVCNATNDASLVSAFIKCGVNAIISAEALPSEYAAAVHAALTGGMFMSMSLFQMTMSARETSPKKDNPYNLTEREVDVLMLLSEGLSNKEIARKLDLSVRTAETHRLNIRRKTDAGGLSDLMRVAKSINGQIAADQSTLSPPVALLGN